MPIMTSTRFNLVLIVCVFLIGCDPSPQGIRELSNSLSHMREEQKRIEAAHERERPCPELQLSGMEVAASATSKSTQKKFKPAYVGIAPEIVTASKSSWNKECWAVSGINPYILGQAIRKALESNQLSKGVYSDEKPDYILEARVLEQWEKSLTNGVEDFSKEGRLTLKYTVLNPDTKAIVWEKQVTTTAKVNYGSQAKEDKLLPEQITSNEYRRIIFESAVKQNLTILVEELRRL